MLSQFLYRRFCPALPVALLLIFTAIVAGCRPSAPSSNGGTGRFAVPTENEARLVYTEVEARTPDRLHCKWTIIGGRNWVSASAASVNQDVRFSLTQPYPLNDTTQAHGTNVYECDLTAERLRDQPKTVKWSVVLHGSNGSTAQSTGTVSLTQDLNNTVQVLVDRDTTAQLPAKDIALARIGDKNLSLTLER